MENMIVRLQYAELNNFQNVKHGHFNFACNLKDNIFEQTSDILGIYGQNGSGKTTFIHALSVLQSLLSGKKLPEETANYITKGENKSTFSFEFSLTDNKSFYKVIYDFSISRKAQDFWTEEADNSSPVIVSYERIRYSSYKDGEWSRLVPLVNCNMMDEKVFEPATRLKELSFGNSKIIDELRVAKKLALKQSTSFVFSNETQKQILENDTIFRDILYSLFIYGRTNLYIIGNRDSGLISLNSVLPFSFKMENDKTLSIGSIPIRLDTTTCISEKIYSILSEVIEVMNTVLCEIVPGLKVELINQGRKMMQDGTEGINIELASVKSNLKIPLGNESEGIKKIISILHMLIAMYNNPSMTLAIDELDSGIFEYLLGEILNIIKESGKGQLIFTSHNLRPLEVLNKKSILLTTTNSSNRYIRLSNVNTNNNLRDFYFHDIILGGQKEPIYESTNNFSIGRAFRMAGEHH